MWSRQLVKQDIYLNIFDSFLDYCLTYHCNSICDINLINKYIIFSYKEKNRKKK